MKFFFSFLIFIIVMGTIQIYVEAEIIECNYWRFRISEMKKEIYYCSVRNIEIFSSGLKVTIDGVTGKHSDENFHDPIEGVKITRAKNISFFPSNIEIFFPNLTLIGISESKLAHITKEDLKPFTKLEVLFLHKNLLEIIPEDLFIYNQELEVIWLNGNRIRYIDGKTFSNLKNLRYLSLHKNLCKMSDDYGVTRNEVLVVVRSIERGSCQLPEITALIMILKQEIEELKSQLNAKEREYQKLLDYIN